MTSKIISTTMLHIGKSIPVFLAVLAVLYGIARPHAENLILKTVDGRASKLEAAFKEYRMQSSRQATEQRKIERRQDEKAAEISNKQSVIIEKQRIGEILDTELRQNVSEILRIMRTR